MTKKVINQNTKLDVELINSIESKYIFSKNPINRIKKKMFEEVTQLDKKLALSNLSKKISSIENCDLKKNAKQIVLGCGNINSPLMLIGGTPNVQEDISGLPFEGEVGNLLKKMLSAININDENVANNTSTTNPLNPPVPKLFTNAVRLVITSIPQTSPPVNTYHKIVTGTIAIITAINPPKNPVK